MDYDKDKVDEAVLALAYLTLHDGARVWKSFDWDAMSRLYEFEVGVPRPLVYCPRSRADYEGFQGFITSREAIDLLADALSSIS